MFLRQYVKIRLQSKKWIKHIHEKQKVYCKMHNRQQKGKRNMSQNVLVVHGCGPTAVINASLYCVIEEA